jgi:hypothetical protein
MAMPRIDVFSMFRITSTMPSLSVLVAPVFVLPLVSPRLVSTLLVFQSSSLPEVTLSPLRVVSTLL